MLLALNLRHVRAFRSIYTVRLTMNPKQIGVTVVCSVAGAFIFFMITIRWAIMRFMRRPENNPDGHEIGRIPDASGRQ